jgi:Flp pilus assembly protein protease CpaA
MDLPELVRSAPWIPHTILLIWLAVCAVQDWRKREVSNWLTLPVFFLGILFALGVGGETLALTLITLFVFLGARAIWKAQGAADIKVLVALAALWPQALFAALIVTATWSLLLIIRGQGKGGYAGVPPMAFGSFLVMILFDLLPYLKILFPI